MGRLRRSKRRAKTNGRQDLCPLLLIFVITIVPSLGTIVVQMATTLSDLTEKRVRPSVSAEILPVVDWPTLLQASGPTGPDRPLPRTPVRMLGYMTDGDHPIPNGRRVKVFLLTPEGGTLLHPAHRLPKDMVRVQVAAMEGVPFQARALVWVQGRLVPRIRAAPPETPGHILCDAVVQGADRQDLTLYFTNR